MSNPWVAPVLSTPPGPPARTIDSRCLSGFDDLVGRTVTKISTLCFPTGVLIVCGDVYLAVRIEEGYEGAQEFSHAPAHITELHEIGFATQADLDAHDKARREANQFREKLEYARLKEKFEGKP